MLELTKKDKGAGKVDIILSTTKAEADILLSTLSQFLTLAGKDVYMPGGEVICAPHSTSNSPLKVLRKRSGMTQTELAKKLTKEFSYKRKFFQADISEFENNRKAIDTNTGKKLARALNAPIDTFVCKFEHSAGKTPLPLSKENERGIQDAVASCAIEGMRISKADKEMVVGMFNQGLTPDEMIAELKKGIHIR